MICRVCNEDINEKCQDNVSTISGYPICEDCKDEVCCEDCYETYNLYYLEQVDKVLCKSCLIETAEKMGYINSAKKYFTDEWREICNDNDLEPVVDFLKDNYGLQEMVGE